MNNELVAHLRARMMIIHEIDCFEWVPDALCHKAADEIEALAAQLAEARESERAAMTEVNGIKDALAQVPEFICRKCGRRQNGPTDNEARF